MQRARTDEAKDLRRQALLKAALDAFYEKGFSATRMEDIAKSASVSKGTLYLYFTSKEHIFTSLVETLAIPNVDRLELATQNAPNFADAIGALTHIAPHIIQTTDIPKLMKIIVAEARNFPALISMYRQNVIERVLRIITNILEKAHESGEITAEDPALVARLVIAPIALSALWKIITDGQEDEVDLKKLFHLHGEMILCALSYKRAAT